MHMCMIMCVRVHSHAHTRTRTHTHKQIHTRTRARSVLGTPQSEDAVVYHIPEQPEWMTGASITDDGRCVRWSVVVEVPWQS